MEAPSFLGSVSSVAHTSWSRKSRETYYVHLFTIDINVVLRVYCVKVSKRYLRCSIIGVNYTQYVVVGPRYAEEERQLYYRWQWPFLITWEHCWVSN